MHWFSQNYQWIFSGIGVLVLALLIDRWRKSRRNPSGKENRATLTAQGAKVTGSPVASGSGITQVVNSPTRMHLNMGRTVESALPQLNVEVCEVCFEDVLDSLREDWADFTLERYIFVHIWIVNRENVATAVKEWALTYSMGGKLLAASKVSDFSKWRQHVPWEERGTGFVSGVLKETHNPLIPFPTNVLQQGIPLQGWVCFKATGVSGMSSDGGSIELCILDSFGQTYRIESPAPFACKGKMFNPELHC
jgi:hypothetical protein